jgi:DNA-binding response OmpR family regulator
MTRKALIIEDDEIMIANLTELLDLEGFDVRSTSRGSQALEWVRSFQPDIILSDMYLPDSDGLAILDAVRGSPASARTPFIFLTGQGESDHMRAALERGADGYFVKPFEIMDLLRLIEHLLPAHC